MPRYSANESGFSTFELTDDTDSAARHVSGLNHRARLVASGVVGTDTVSHTLLAAYVTDDHYARGELVLNRTPLRDERLLREGVQRFGNYFVKHKSMTRGHILVASVVSSGRITSESEVSALEEMQQAAVAPLQETEYAPLRIEQGVDILDASDPRNRYDAEVWCRRPNNEMAGVQALSHWGISLCLTACVELSGQ